MAVFSPYLNDLGWDIPGTEKKMQDLFVEFLKNQKYYRHKEYETEEVRPMKILTEYHIPEIKRRSDVVMVMTKRKIVNFELKLTDIKGVFDQALDHKRWADYSYIVMPAGVHLVRHELANIASAGIGMMLYHKGDFIEIIPPAWLRGGTDKAIRFKVNLRLFHNKD